MKINPLIVNAAKVLDGAQLSTAEAMDLALNIFGEDIMDLAALANKVRIKFAGPVTACSIINAKSGVCSQNCRFCAQSGCYATGIETYPLMPAGEVLAAAREVVANGVRSFGYVTSGYGYTDPEDEEFKAICATLDALHDELPELRMCVSIGILSEACAAELARHHVWRYNMNLQTNPERYAALIADTHSISDKIDTIKYLQQHKITICCGGIIGLGESWEDRVEMAAAIRDLKVEGIPLNVLLPIKGTPLEHQVPITAAEVIKTFAIFRLVNPRLMIKFAAGRETVMKDFQALALLSGANSMITGGYLTTRGRLVSEDRNLIAQLRNFSN